MHATATNYLLLPKGRGDRRIKARTKRHGEETMPDPIIADGPPRPLSLPTIAVLLGAALTTWPCVVCAQAPKIVKSDYQIDALDPGIKLFMREKMAEGNTMSSFGSAPRGRESPVEEESTQRVVD